MKKSLNSLARFSIVVLLVSCLLSVSAFAADISSTVYDDEEYRKITEVCAAFPVTITEYTFSEEDVAEAYKRYVMDSGVFFELITSDLSYTDLVMKDTGAYWDLPYTWIVPVKNGMYEYEVPYSKQEGGFYVNGFSIYEESLGLSPGFLNFGEIEKILEEKSAEGLTGDQVCFTITSSIPVSFFAFSTEKDRYLIPYTFRSDLTGLTCGMCYTAAEVREILNETLPVQFADEAGSAEALAGGNNTSQYRKDELTEKAWRARLDKIEGWEKKKSMLSYWWVAAGGVVVIAAAAVIVSRVVRKLRNK